MSIKFFTYRIKIALCVSLFLISLSSSQFSQVNKTATSNQSNSVPSQYPRMTNAIADEMTKTYSYYMFQLFLVQELSKKFPEMATDLSKAQLHFDRTFKPSIITIDAIMTKENTTWATDKPAFLETAKNKIASVNVTEAQAKAFVAELTSRANGKLTSPVLETLLIYNPDFLKQPAEEFICEYKQTFRTKDHPKSKGIDLQIDFPRSWKILEGKRPNVISTLKSENGRGDASVLFIVKDLPIDRPITQPEIKELLHPTSLKELVPETGKFISSTPVKLDGLSGAVVKYDVEQLAVEIPLIMRFMMYVVPYKNKLIMIQCGVALLKSEEAILNNRFVHFEPLFKLIVNSVVVQNQYQ